MENFVLPEGTDTLKDSRELLNNALLTVRSLSSGTEFPTNNLSAGMVCYRTDLKRLYQYKEDGSWTADVAMSISGNANTANSARTATNAEHANTATNAEHANTATNADHADTATNADHADTASTADKCTGNAATATALQTKRNINGTPFDGTTDITIVNTIKQGGTGATTASEALANLGALPLTGGTIAGAIFSDCGSNATIAHKTNNGIVRIFGGSSASTGANLDLYGEEHTDTNGGFILRARNTSGFKVLQGKVDGTLTWDGKSIVGNVYYATCSTAVGTTAKVATVTSGTFSLVKGVVVFINATNGFKGGGKLTLNVNSTGAKYLYHNSAKSSWGSTGEGQDYYDAGNYIACVYDGSAWGVLSGVTSGRTPSSGT